MRRAAALAWFVRAADRLSVCGMIGAAVSALAMAFLVTAEVLLRLSANISTQVSDEWAGYLLVSTCFLGMGYTVQERGFIQVELILNRLGPASLRWLILGHRLAAAIVGLVLGYWLAVQTAQSYRMGFTSIFVSRTPIWIPQIFMVIGLAQFVFQVVAEILREAIEGEKT